MRRKDVKKIKKEVKRLAKQKKFEQIYDEYGPNYFREYVSSKYKKEDIKKLKKEGKYLDIYIKYGETYTEAYRKDLENELGRKSTLRERIVNNLNLDKGTYQKALIKSILYGLSSTLLIPSISTNIEIKENSQKYEKEIEEYEKNIKDYAKGFDADKQSDMEIIMRTMKDLHETIKGYGEPLVDAVRISWNGCYE